MIRKAVARDAASLCGIYNHYVEKTIVTFEESPVPEQEMARRIEDITVRFPWIVYEEEGRIQGYAYAGQWKGRCSYRFSLESTVYLYPGATGRGIGSLLYRHLLNLLKKGGYHTVIAGISLPNEQSRKLHEKFGFVKVAHFPEVGFKLDRWIDVGYWQLLLEPRDTPRAYVLQAENGGVPRTNN